MGLCQGFLRVLDMTQILFREICFLRKEVLPYPEDFAQIALVGLLSLRNSVYPCVRCEGIGNDLQHSPTVVPQFSSVFSLPEETVCCVCCRDWPFLMVTE